MVYEYVKWFELAQNMVHWLKLVVVCSVLKLMNVKENRHLNCA
jgi:hypothetical protein